jgi:hypothetical protein
MGGFPTPPSENWLDNVLAGAFFILVGGLPLLSVSMFNFPMNDIVSSLIITIFILAIFIIGAGGIISGFRKRAKIVELFDQWDWRAASVISLILIIIVSLIASVGYIIFFRYVLHAKGAIKIGGIAIFGLIILSYVIWASWLMRNRKSLYESQSYMPLDGQLHAITEGDPILGTWYSPGKEVEAKFHPDGTFDMISVERYGQAESYLGGKVRKDHWGYYIVRVGVEGSSKQDAVVQPETDRKFILDNKCLFDVNNINIRFVRDFNENDPGVIKNTRVSDSQQYPGNIERSSRISWIYLFISLVILAGISIVLFTAMVGTGFILASMGVNSLSLIGINALHLFAFGVFLIISFFICGLIFILGYFSSPFFIDEMQQPTVKIIKIEANSWDYAIYNNLTPGDGRSRAAFCLAYLLPPMMLFGGIFLTIGIMALGIFGPITHASNYELAIGVIIWVAMAVISFVLRDRLMKKFVKEGTISGIKPIPPPMEYPPRIFGQRD